METKNTQLEDAMHNVRTMDSIVDFMKEERTMSDFDMAEEKDDVSPLTRVEFPDEGGILTFMEGKEHPYRGFPHAGFVDSIDGAKKLMKYFLQRFHYVIRTAPKWKLLSLMPAFWLHKQLIFALLYALYRIVERHRIKSVRYSQPVREVHRVLTEMAPLAKVERDENRVLQFRDVFCMYLEFDNAYRFRFQDLMEELDKEEAVKNPSKEISRLYAINATREVEEEMVEKQQQYGDFFRYLFGIKSYKRMAQEFFKRLNLEEVKLSKEDRFWCQPRTDYHFGFCERGELKCNKHQ